MSSNAWVTGLEYVVLCEKQLATEEYYAVTIIISQKMTSQTLTSGSCDSAQLTVIWNSLILSQRAHKAYEKKSKIDFLQLQYHTVDSYEKHKVSCYNMLTFHKITWRKWTLRQIWTLVTCTVKLLVSIFHISSRVFTTVSLSGTQIKSALPWVGSFKRLKWRYCAAFH